MHEFILIALCSSNHFNCYRWREDYRDNANVRSMVNAQNYATRRICNVFIRAHTLITVRMLIYSQMQCVRCQRNCIVLCIQTQTIRYTYIKRKCANVFLVRAPDMLHSATASIHPYINSTHIKSSTNASHTADARRDAL